MITSEEALKVAHEYLRGKFPGADLVIVETLERPIGWGVIYQFRKYLETRDPDEMLIGPGPLLILRSDGSVVELMTFQPIDDEIRDYVRSHRQGS